MSWAVGHSDQARCRSCNVRTTAKPIPCCTEARHAEYYHRRCERNNAYRRERRAAARASGTVYRGGRGNMARKLARGRIAHIQLRSVLFDRLGSKACQRCGFSDERALQFDHIHGGGRQHRLSLRSGSSYYRQLIAMSKTELRATFQVLCANCNCIKRIENEEWRRACSHSTS